MKRKISEILTLSSLLAVFVISLTIIQPAQAASWVTNSPMTVARYGHTATMLPSGKVLVTGGIGTNSVLNSAELYDSANGTWINTGSLNEARYAHTATLLPNGKVLVIGGISASFFPSPIASAELYDPGTGIWTPTSPDPVGRYAHTATLLPNGKVLVVGGSSSSLPGDAGLSSAMLYDPSTETWTDAGTMNAGHTGHTATLLPNGKVLITGGTLVGSGLAATVANTVELYNPTDGTWTMTGPLNTARYVHTATLLPNGQVLVAGGYGTNGTLGSAELYNPSNETWTMTGALNTARYDHSATLSPDGKVLVAGGDYSDLNTNVIISTAELYSPSDGTWTPVASLNNARYAHSATLLPGGNVLITGGLGYNGIGFFGFPATAPLSSTEVYDPGISPATGTSSETGKLNILHRISSTASLLTNGQVLVAGGWMSSGDVSGAELYDPLAGSWLTTASMATARDSHTATLLPDGRVLVAGGYNYDIRNILSSAELYDPVAKTWKGALPMNSFRENHTATLLPNGKVLVAGGLFNNSAEIYDPATGTWTLTGSMNVQRYFQTATLLPNRKVLVTGGYYPIHSSAELYDPESGTWSMTGAMNTARRNHSATLLPNGKVLVAGGFGSGDVYLASAEIYDPAIGAWTTTGTMTVARNSHTAILLSNSKVLVQGGFTSNGVTDSSELYDPASGVWTTAGPMVYARFSQTATLLANGKVLVAVGGGSSSGDSSELYDMGIGYSNAWQPQITAVTSPLNLGSSLVVTGAKFQGIAEGSSGNTQDSSADYPLVQLRSIESGQTVFLSSTNWGTNSFTSLPVWNFPPGHALATVFVNGIQSTSSVVNISVSMPTATTLTGAQQVNGAFQFSFTNNPGALLGVLVTTNLSLPLTNWTQLGGVVEIAPGQFQFNDPQATNGGQRFYSLFAP